MNTLKFCKAGPSIYYFPLCLWKLWGQKDHMFNTIDKIMGTWVMLLIEPHVFPYVTLFTCDDFSSGEKETLLGIIRK